MLLLLKLCGDCAFVFMSKHFNVNNLYNCDIFQIKRHFLVVGTRNDAKEIICFFLLVRQTKHPWCIIVSVKSFKKRGFKMCELQKALANHW